MTSNLEDGAKMTFAMTLDLALIGYGTVPLVHFGFANVVVLEINRQMLQVVSIDKKP
ncbi:MAG: hypothetical protein WB988_00495 [Candidatus Nitrosopolaris sp.]